MADIHPPKNEEFIYYTGIGCKPSYYHTKDEFIHIIENFIVKDDKTLAEIYYMDLLNKGEIQEEYNNGTDFYNYNNWLNHMYYNYNLWINLVGAEIRDLNIRQYI